MPSPEEVLKKLRKHESNKSCANCENKSPIGFGNVCVPFKTFVCDMCKSAHQSFSHRVKSISMSTWTKSEVSALKKKNGGGNEIAKSIWLNKLTSNKAEKYQPNPHSSLTDYKRFIEMVYEKKKFFKEPSLSKDTTDTNNTTDSPEIKKKSSKKKKKNDDNYYNDDSKLEFGTQATKDTKKKSKKQGKSRSRSGSHNLSGNRAMNHANIATTSSCNNNNTSSSTTADAIGLFGDYESNAFDTNSNNNNVTNTSSSKSSSSHNYFDVFDDTTNAASDPFYNNSNNYDNNNTLFDDLNFGSFGISTSTTTAVSTTMQVPPASNAAYNDEPNHKPLSSACIPSTTTPVMNDGYSLGASAISSMFEPTPTSTGTGVATTTNNHINVVIQPSNINHSLTTDYNDHNASGLMQPMRQTPLQHQQHAMKVPSVMVPGGGGGFSASMAISGINNMVAHSSAESRRKSQQNNIPQLQGLIYGENSIATPPNHHHHQHQQQVISSVNTNAYQLPVASSQSTKLDDPFANLILF